MTGNSVIRWRWSRVLGLSAISALVAGSLITNGELLQTDLSGNQPPVARAGADRSLGVAPLQLVLVSLDGSQSSDPDGDGLSFEWRGPGGNLIGSAALVNLTLAAGSYVFGLTVRDGRGATASDSVHIDVLIDASPPAVIPPEDRGISTTGSGGTSGDDSPALAEFLAGGEATDDLDTTLTRLSPQVGGVDVGNATLFPLGTTTVTFRFRDSSGNVGTGTADLTVIDLHEGDLFVGAGIVADGFGNTYGTVQLVRGPSVSPFCQSPTASFDPGFFNVPQDVIVDSRGRVVFLAPTRPGLTLFRCDTVGATPTKLAVFPTRAAPDPGDPVPIQGKIENVSGLHLARTRSILIDDNVDGGTPKLATDDLYGLVVATLDPDTNQRSGLRTVRYRPRTGEWEDGPEPPQKYARAGSTYMPDAVSHGGATYFAHEEVIRKFTDPLRLDASAHLGNFDFRLIVSIFAGFREVDGVTTDDDKIPNVPTGCTPVPQVRNDMPFKSPGLVGTSRLYGVVFDEYGGLGLVIATDYAFLTPYLTNVSDALLNESGEDDPKFQQPFRECMPFPVLDHSSILPFFAPDGSGNGATSLATASGGLVATQAFSGRVVRVTPGSAVEPIATGLVRPTGISSYPAAVPAASGLVVVIRIDSPVDVLVTDANGRRIGVDPSSGLPVNDFGEKGFDSGPGEPRYYAIRDPLPGSYQASAVGTGAGSYAMNAFSMNFGSGAGSRIRAIGSTSPGSTAAHDFTLESAGRLAFVPTNRPPVADAGPDQIKQATSSEGALVTLNGSASSDPDGDDLVFTWAGPFGPLAGAVVSQTLSVGSHSINLVVADGHGGTSDDTVLITVLPADTPTPTATETESPTPVPTDVPSTTPTRSPTDILVPSATPTAVPTETSTPMPSPTPTASLPPTSTRTSTPPPPVTPPATFTPSPVVGRTKGYWSTAAGHALLDAAPRDGLVDFPITLGEGARGIAVITFAQSDKILKDRACAAGSPSIFSCSNNLSDALNSNTLEVMAAQTLALSYNIAKIPAYDGQTIDRLGCRSLLTANLRPAPASLGPESTVGRVRAVGNLWIGQSTLGGSTTQQQAAAINKLVDCLNGSTP